MIICENFVKSWFVLQRQLMTGLQLAYVDLQGASVSPEGLTVLCPDDQVFSEELALAAKLASTSGAPVSGTCAAPNGGDDHLRIAYPLQLGQHARGAVVVEVSAPLERQAAILQMLKWGEGWLKLALTGPVEQERSRVLPALVKDTLLQANLADASTLVLSSLEVLTGSSRVALGVGGRQGVRFESLSGFANPDRSSLHVTLLERVMQEAVEAGEPVVWSRGAVDRERMLAHQRLGESAELAALCSVPIVVSGLGTQVFCFEYAKKLRHIGATAALCEESALIVSPALALQRERSRPWRQRMALLCRELLDDLVCFRGRNRKVTLCVGALVLCIFLFGHSEYRIAAAATVEGAVQQAVVAPFDGYVVDAPVRAGENVSRDQVLARLDDRKLKGELRKLQAEELEFVEQHRQAVVTLDQGKARVLDSQLKQARARLDLVREQIHRTQLSSPLDGVVISGDWARSVGGPVNRGEVLFEVAPLDQYRVAMLVEDRDIAGLAAGQAGEIVLSAHPSRAIPFAVSTISFSAVDEVGIPMFRVEGALNDAVPGLRPGMQGVARIVTGERPRWWLWTHRLTHWLRMQYWSIKP